MYYTNVYTAPIFDSSMGASCSWQTRCGASRAEIEALEGDFHLVGRLAGWANGVGGVCIGVTQDYTGYTATSELFGDDNEWQRTKAYPP